MLITFTYCLISQILNVLLHTPFSRAGEKATSTNTDAPDCSSSFSTDNSDQSIPNEQSAVEAQHDCVSPNSLCSRELCDSRLCNSLDQECVNIAVEGGGEQAAEVLPLDESCCQTDPEKPGLTCLSDLIDGASVSASEEHQCSPTVNNTAEDGHSSPVAEDTPNPGSLENTSYSVSVSEKGKIPEQELYNSFHYWRTPIPQIDLDLELLEEKCNNSSKIFANNSSAQVCTPTLDRKQLVELIENLEPHIDDPDVKGK